MPLGVEGNQKSRSEDETRPVPLAKTFDSFDATLRLAAMTDQTEDFRDYITATQKMRAYKGKIESTSPLAPQAAVAQEERKKPAFRPVAAPPPPTYGSRTLPPGNTTASNVVAVIAIVVLAMAAIALAIALLVK
jgi:hypothetical protein